MRVQAIAVAVAAWMIAGCASVESTADWPKPIREVAVEHGPLAVVALHGGGVRVGTFIDARNVTDKAHIGELQGPVLVSPAPGGAAPVFATLQLLALAHPVPTGKFVTLKDAASLNEVFAHGMRDALLQAGYAVEAVASPELQGTIIEFWLRPSWTVVCNVRVELRLVDDGNVRWRKQLDAQHEKFIGLWTEDEFAGVIRAAMDSLLNRAAAEFASEEFAALATGR